MLPQRKISDRKEKSFFKKFPKKKGVKKEFFYLMSQITWQEILTGVTFFGQVSGFKSK
jgi:hypothetical protein